MLLERQCSNPQRGGVKLLFYKTSFTYLRFSFVNFYAPGPGVKIKRSKSELLKFPKAKIWPYFLNS